MDQALFMTYQNKKNTITEEINKTKNELQEVIKDKELLDKKINSLNGINLKNRDKLNINLDAQNYPKIDSEIALLNDSIKMFNKKNKEYEKQANKLIEEKIKLTSDELIYETKINKLKELLEDLSKVKSEIGNKYDELSDLENEIESKNEASIDFMGWIIKVRKNYLKDERTDAIVNFTDGFAEHNKEYSTNWIDKSGYVRNFCF